MSDTGKANGRVGLTYNKASQIQSYQIMRWIDEHKAIAQSEPDQAVAEKMALDLNFPVTTGMVLHRRLQMGIQKRSAKASAKAGPGDASEHAAILAAHAAQIRTISEALIRQQRTIASLSKLLRDTGLFDPEMDTIATLAESAAKEAGK